MPVELLYAYCKSPISMLVRSTMSTTRTATGADRDLWRPKTKHVS